LKITFLGVNNAESKHTKLVSFLIDNVIAVDAGSITSSLTFSEQQRIHSLLISHAHFDHIKDILMFGFNNRENTTHIYATNHTHRYIQDYLLNGVLYPNFTEINSFLPQPPLKLIEVVPFEPIPIDTYTIRAFPVNHKLQAVGFEVKAKNQKTIFYTGDTGQNLSEIWHEVTPDLLIIDATFPDSLEQTAKNAKHLCPQLIDKELETFYQINRYYPKIYLTHMSPQYIKEIENDVKKLNKENEYCIHLAQMDETISV